MSASLPLPSAPVRGQPGPLALRIFFLPFFLIGAGLFCGVTLWPVYQVYAARHWPQIPCVVDSSQLIAEPGEDSASYRVEIVYHYTFAGQAQTSRSAVFGAGFPNGYRSKQAMVDRYPVGRESVCFVNPSAPDQAVLDRGWQPEMGRGIFGGFLALAAGLGLVFAPDLARWKAGAENSPKVMPGTGGPVLLTAKRAPLGKFLAVLIGTLAFSSFIGFVAYLLFFVEDRQDVARGPKIIINLFLFACFLFICHTVTHFLALFRPRVHVTVQNTTIPVGGELHVSWTVTGKISRLQKMRLTLEGRHGPELRGGRMVRTKKQVFARVTIYDASNRVFPAQGTAQVVVPNESGDASAGEQFWAIHVRGEILKGEDVDDEYPLRVVGRA